MVICGSVGWKMAEGVKVEPHTDRVAVRVSKSCPDPWSYWIDTLGAPKNVVAPMVDQSELPFRLLCREYGAHLAYTPMWHGRLFVNDAKYRKKMLLGGQSALDRPLLAHFCLNDTDIAAKIPETLKNEGIECDGIDINLGCPQGIAKKGCYGSFLLDKPELIESIIRTLDTNSHIPITAKIRLVTAPTRSESIERTLSLARRIEMAGAAVLCVHGRCKEDKSQFVKSADWEAIRAVKRHVGIPVIGNGGVETYEDAQKFLNYTGVDAVMSAVGILEYPAVFHKPMEEPSADPTAMANIDGNVYDGVVVSSALNGGKRAELVRRINPVPDHDDLGYRYLELCRLHTPTLGAIRAHFFHMFHAVVQEFKLHSLLGQSKSLNDFQIFLDTIREKRALSEKPYRLGYYRRYRRITENAVTDDGGTSRETQKRRKITENAVTDGEQGYIRAVP